jgi:poly-gamma-glutamate system protein
VKNLPSNIRLLVVFTVLLAVMLLVHFRLTRSIPLDKSGQMKRAVALACQWFEIIRMEKETRGIRSDALIRAPNQFMIGNDFTPLTTTLGSLNSKEISTNPDFAALMVRLLHEAGAETGDKAGLIISGSFPALAVSTLAAFQVMEMDVVMISSLGASTYGANQPGATWIDMENWLIQKGGLCYRSALVSAGAENDRGEGLMEEGLEMIRVAAERNGRDLYIPENLVRSIHHKTRILEEENIRVLVNIGGSQTALGGCVHASTLPNGLQRKMKFCRHTDRGIIQEINSRGIPVINLLNIRELSANYGIDPAPGQNYAESRYLYTRKEPNRGALAVALFLELLVTGYFLRDYKTLT